MQGRVVLITGATSGIGRELAYALALQGARLVLACRKLEQAQALCAELIRESGNPQIAVLALDLGSLRSVRQCAAEFLDRYAQLDVLINNAGTFCLQRQETEDGFERTLGVNYLGPFLLTNCLVPLLSTTAGARIVNVGSAAYRYGRLELADLQMNRRYAGFRAYAASKLALQLWTQELAERLRAQGVTANVAHPGHVATGIWRLWPQPRWYQRLFIRLITSFMISARAGARTPLYLATAPEVAGLTGGYFAQERAQVLKLAPRDRALQPALWAMSMQLTQQ